MGVVATEAPDLIRAAFAKQRPGWEVVDVSLVVPRFGGFLVVVACENTAPAPEGAARFADEVCYVSAKGDVTCFSDIASFANFLIWYERRPFSAKWLTLPLFFRCLWLAGLIFAALSLDEALAGGSTLHVAGAMVSMLGFGWLVISRPPE